MFDGIGPFDWLVIGCALALGFGLVKFMLVAGEQKRLEREAGGPTAPRAGRAWHDVLGVAPDASWQAVSAAYEARRAQCRPRRPERAGEELPGSAERVAKELDDAYEEARARHTQGGS